VGVIRVKKKVGTVLDEKLLLEAKQVALIQNKSLSKLFEDALKNYLSNFQKKRGTVDATKGSMKISPINLKAIMEEESVFES